MIKKLVAKFVKDKDDVRLFASAVVLLAAAFALAVYDVVTIATGTVDANRHIPFVAAFGIAGFAGCILVVLRHGVRTGRRPDLDRVRRDSYQHPDHWPRGRINAPDGLSD